MFYSSSGRPISRAGAKVCAHAAAQGCWSEQSANGCGDAESFASCNHAIHIHENFGDVSVDEEHRCDASSIGGHFNVVDGSIDGTAFTPQQKEACAAATTATQRMINCETGDLTGKFRPEGFNIGKKGKPFLIGPSFKGKANATGTLLIGVVPFRRNYAATGTYKVRLETD